MKIPMEFLSDQQRRGSLEDQMTGKVMEDLQQ